MIGPSAMTPLVINVSLELEDDIKAMAKEFDMNISAFCRMALREFISSVDREANERK